MSQSLFDEKVTWREISEQEDEYEVGGPFGDGRAPKRGVGDEPDVRIVVMIWQTDRDTQDTKDTQHVTEVKTIAFAMDEGKLVTNATGIGEQAQERQRWTATLRHRKVSRQHDGHLSEFKTGFPATGLAVSVDCAEDPAGFEIFTWSGRISFVREKRTADLTVSPG
jgi:hypothetical protein